jgi:hypothetical protein
MPHRGNRRNRNAMRLGNDGFLMHINRFIGETVTIITTSGDVSGGEFTGVMFKVNSDFVRLIIENNTPPTNSPTENNSPKENNNRGISDQEPGDIGSPGGKGSGDSIDRNFTIVGSVVDIPVDRITAFVHSAV